MSQRDDLQFVHGPECQFEGELNDGSRSCDCPRLPEVDGSSALDRQEGGDHYKQMGRYQPFEVLEKWLDPDEFKGYAKGTAIAYLARERLKGRREDIKKAVHTLQIYLELTENDDERRPE